MNAETTIQRVEEAWASRAKTQGYKPGTKRYREAELEFIVGAMVVMDLAGIIAPPNWVVAAMRGEAITNQKVKTS